MFAVCNQLCGFLLSTGAYALCSRPTPLPSFEGCTCLQAGAGIGQLQDAILSHFPGV